MDVSIFAAFVAGLVSFLSPCVLPLVPGYISMLSGIGVEQLKEGKTPRAGLLASALAFVTRIFRRLHFLWSIRQCRRFLPAAQSRLARARRGRAHRPVWPAPYRPARENFRARRILIGCALVAAGIALALRPHLLGAWLKPITSSPSP